MEQPNSTRIDVPQAALAAALDDLASQLAAVSRDLAVHRAMVTTMNAELVQLRSERTSATTPNQ